MRKVTMNMILAGAAAVALLPAVTAHAATWGGGTGDWVSAADNWGLGAGASPGDGAHPTEAAVINSGTVNVEPGNTINLTGNPGTVTVSYGATLNQLGGNLTSSARFTVYNQYTLSGGKLDGTNFWVTRNGVYSISGGQFGTRSSLGPDSIMDFTGYGNGTLNITGGAIDLHSIKMMDLIAGGGYTTHDAMLQVTGNTASLKTLFFYLYSSPDASGFTSNSTASFIFSSLGISGWTLTGGGNNLNLGTGADRGLLSVDVNAFTSNGTTGYSLINYSGTILGDGTFGSVSILDSHYAGGLTLGTKGSLLPGQYYLDMADSTVGDGTTIALYFNNTVPEPASMALLLLGGMVLAARRRRS